MVTFNDDASPEQALELDFGSESSLVGFKSEKDLTGFADSTYLCGDLNSESILPTLESTSLAMLSGTTLGLLGRRPRRRR